MLLLLHPRHSCGAQVVHFSRTPTGGANPTHRATPDSGGFYAASTSPATTANNSDIHVVLVTTLPVETVVLGRAWWTTLVPRGSVPAGNIGPFPYDAAQLVAVDMSPDGLSLATNAVCSPCHRARACATCTCARSPKKIHHAHRHTSQSRARVLLALCTAQPADSHRPRYTNMLAHITCARSPRSIYGSPCRQSLTSLIHQHAFAGARDDFRVQARVDSGL